MDYTFYIPKNVSTRFELVKGIGINIYRNSNNYRRYNSIYNKCYY